MLNDKIFNQRLRDILKVHFNEKSGTIYWLEKARELGISPFSEIQSIQDLKEFGPMDDEAMRTRPVEDFIPRKYWGNRISWIIGETGGTSGIPKTTVYSKDDFFHAFIYPFKTVAEYRKFPRGKNWLWIGPGGPHLIGQAARECAKVTESPDPFSVDFDPRWAKKLPQDSIGFKRYLEHVIEQAMRIIEIQKIQIIFSTPKVLVRLKEVMSETLREKILGIHFGGMALTEEAFASIEAAFPRAIMISGYGNTLYGMCPEFH